MDPTALRCGRRFGRRISRICGRSIVAGKLKIAGPFTDGSGSLIIVDMESEAEARAFANSDPYVKGGVFERVEVKPFRQVFPE